MIEGEEEQTWLQVGVEGGGKGVSLEPLICSYVCEI